MGERCDGGCRRHATIEWYRPTDAQRWVLCDLHSDAGKLELLRLGYLELKHIAEVAPA